MRRIANRGRRRRSQVTVVVEVEEVFVLYLETSRLPLKFFLDSVTATDTTRDALSCQQPSGRRRRRRVKTCCRRNDP